MSAVLSILFFVLYFYTLKFLDDDINSLIEKVNFQFLFIIYKI